MNLYSYINKMEFPEEIYVNIFANISDSKTLNGVLRTSKTFNRIMLEFVPKLRPLLLTEKTCTKELKIYRRDENDKCFKQYRTAIQNIIYQVNPYGNKEGYYRVYNEANVILRELIYFNDIIISKTGFINGIKFQTWSYKDGKANGLYRAESRDGSVMTGQYINNKRHGLFVKKYGDIIINEGNYNDGKQHGIFKYRAKRNGNLYKEEIFDMGKLVSTKRY